MPKQTYTPITREAARLLGARIQLGRKERRWTLRQLAERVGVTEGTLRKIERGDLSVNLGSAFEAAALVGVPLFDEDPGRRELEAARLADRLAVLPKSVHPPRRIDDDF
jgi:transcriptional regulator with XRE-family HTH domain